jgi:hypothetical protein
MRKGGRKLAFSTLFPISLGAEKRLSHLLGKLPVSFAETLGVKKRKIIPSYRVDLIVDFAGK